jgi:hypothetical protein
MGAWFPSGLILAVAAIAGCSSPSSEPTVVAQPTTAGDSEPSYGYTYQRADGNRLVAGAGSIPDVTPLDIPLSGTPVWVVAAPNGPGTVWAVALTDGTIQGFAVSDGIVSPITISPARVTAGMPIMLRFDSAGAEVVTVSNLQASPFTHPVELGAGRAWIAGAGDLVLEGEAPTRRLAVSALPDARILSDGAGRLLLLTGATDRYGHGVLGDGIEAGAIAMIANGVEPSVVVTVPITAPAVVEGIAPIWADVTGDGRPDITVTVSDASVGARVVVYDEDGLQIAAGPPIGLGRRWRQQIAVAPFGPGGETEIAAVRTPHIGGVAEFYRFEGGELKIVAQIADSGFSSHVIGSRNLDMAAAGDFDGDGRTELLVPDRRLENLIAVRRTEAGAEVAWSAPVGGRLTTNLAGVTFPDGSMALGAGRADGTLRVWGPVR